MMSQKLQDALNAQIRHELENAHLYLSMAAYCHEESLDGMAGWMLVQSKEENEHAMRIFNHLKDRGVRIKLTPLDGPKVEWDSPLSAFEDAYKREVDTTERINQLVALAYAEKDHAAGNMLKWFVDEQVEEEANTSHIAGMLKRIGNSGNGLIMLDRALGQREG